MVGFWTEEKIAFLKAIYPDRGKRWCMEKLGASESQVRTKAAELGLKLLPSATVLLEAARKKQAYNASRRGIKRPEHGETIRRLYAEGKVLRGWGPKPPPKKKIYPKAPIPSVETLKARSEARSLMMRQRHAEHQHPMLGRAHTEETRTKMRGERGPMSEDASFARFKKAYATRLKHGTLVNPHPGTTWKAAWLELGGKRIYARSSWEANYARYLEWLKGLKHIKDWEHEAETFWFDGIRRGCVSYLPDFKVTRQNGSVEYHEVKGWMDARSRTKIARMRRYHPDVQLLVIDSKAYRKLARAVGLLVPGWTTHSKKRG